MAAVTAVLSRYPEAVITEVTHPATGLPAKQNWLPTIKEVTDACRAALEPIASQMAWDKAVAETMASRRQEESGKENALSLVELKAKYGPNWGLDIGPEKPKPTFKAPNAADLAAHYREFGLAFKPKTDQAAE